MLRLADPTYFISAPRPPTSGDPAATKWFSWQHHSRMFRWLSPSSAPATTPSPWAGSRASTAASSSSSGSGGSRRAARVTSLTTSFLRGRNSSRQGWIFCRPFGSFNRNSKIELLAILCSITIRLQIFTPGSRSLTSRWTPFTPLTSWLSINLERVSSQRTLYKQRLPVSIIWKGRRHVWNKTPLVEVYLYGKYTANSEKISFRFFWWKNIEFN